MSATSELVRFSQETIDRINAEHAACEGSYLTALEHAVRCGSMLVEVRKHLPYGNWKTWLDENFHGSRRTADGYIQLHHAHQQDPAALAEAGGIRAALNSIARKVSGPQTTFDTPSQPESEAEAVSGEVVNDPPSGRSDAEIDALLHEVRAAWTANRHLRLCQLIVNASGRSDPFYVEDDDLAMALIDYGN